MGGGVAPWEYLVPPVAIAHTAYNRVANTADFRKINAPGSKNEKSEARGQHNQQVLGEQQAVADAAAADLRYNTTPQNAQEAFASRLRAKAAQTQPLGGASTYLTSSLG